MNAMTLFCHQLINNSLIAQPRYRCPNRIFCISDTLDYNFLYF